MLAGERARSGSRSEIFSPFSPPAATAEKHFDRSQSPEKQEEMVKGTTLSPSGLGTPSVATPCKSLLLRQMQLEWTSILGFFFGWRRNKTSMGPQAAQWLVHHFPRKPA